MFEKDRKSVVNEAKKEPLAELCVPACNPGVFDSSPA